MSQAEHFPASESRNQPPPRPERRKTPSERPMAPSQVTAMRKQAAREEERVREAARDAEIQRILLERIQDPDVLKKGTVVEIPDGPYLRGIQTRIDVAVSEQKGVLHRGDVKYGADGKPLPKPISSSRKSGVDWGEHAPKQRSENPEAIQGESEESSAPIFRLDNLQRAHGITEEDVDSAFSAIVNTKAEEKEPQKRKSA